MEIESRISTTSHFYSLLKDVPAVKETEKLSLNDSLGRILAEDIIADLDQPPFNKSAMDGYACMRKDLPGPLSVSGEIPAGSSTSLQLESGCCFRIFTGAPVPKGADCVIMQEHVVADSNGKIVFIKEETKNNICYKGEDVKSGDTVLKAGTLIKPQHLAIMAAFGRTAPLVLAKINVGIICSGSELVEPSEKPSGSKIRNSNASQLLSQILQIGAKAQYWGIVPDNIHALMKNIEEALKEHDIVLVTGGASVGDYDLMTEVLKKLGAQILLSELNIQPGKPVIYATLTNKHIIGLSGNPVSSFLQFHLVVKPLLLRLSGSMDFQPKTLKVPLSQSIKRKKNNRQQYVPVAFTSSGFAQPVPFNGSAHISALNKVEGFAIIDEDITEAKENQFITILIL